MDKRLSTEVAGTCSSCLEAISFDRNSCYQITGPSTVESRRIAVASTLVATPDYSYAYKTCKLAAICNYTESSQHLSCLDCFRESSNHYYCAFSSLMSPIVIRATKTTAKHTCIWSRHSLHLRSCEYGGKHGRFIGCGSY